MPEDIDTTVCVPDTVRLVEAFGWSARIDLQFFYLMRLLERETCVPPFHPLQD